MEIAALQRFAQRRIPIAAAVLAGSFLITACSHVDAPIRPIAPDEVMVIGHRGAAAHAPENTIPSIREAMARNADAIEIDLRRTKDGEIVAMHDETVDRTTDGSGRVGEHTLADLKRLDAGGWFDPAYRDTRIPTLGEVLDAVPGSTTLILEIKGGNSTYPEAIPRIIEIVRERARENVILKSFAVEDIREFRRLAPEFARLYVFNANSEWFRLVIDDGLRIGTAFDQDVTWLQKHRWFINADFTRRAQAKEFRVVAWDVHEHDDLIEAVCMGVDGIETDYPGRLRGILADWEKRDYGRKCR